MVNKQRTASVICHRRCVRPKRLADLDTVDWASPVTEQVTAGTTPRKDECKEAEGRSREGDPVVSIDRYDRAASWFKELRVPRDDYGFSHEPTSTSDL